MVLTNDFPPKPRTTPFIGGVLVAFFLIWTFHSFTYPTSLPKPTHSPTHTQTRPDPPTFYDDPKLSYSLSTPIHNWDQKRAHYLSHHRPETRIILLSGSQPDPCKNPIGDNLLLKLFKNKVDYCRIHNCDVFYNNVLLDPNMPSYWAKYPVIRAAMLAHPESEWIWWVDSDAVITDMDFILPLQKYSAHNLILHGWPDLIFGKRSWTGLNAGVFLIRNCQWSMDLLDRWVNFSPTSPDYLKWGSILKSIFKDKLYSESDDQTALGYLLVKEGSKWGDKIYLENEYYFEGYWVEIVGKLGTVSDRYKKLDRRRRAEKGERFEAEKEEVLKGLRRPFITHFTGCQPCNGKHNPMYSGDECWDGMVKALNFADDQVLRNFGYFRPNLSNSSVVELLSFN